MKERNYGLDLLRVFLSICVIALHSFTYFGEMDNLFGSFLPVILIAADGLFYMLSGYFNLQKEFKNSSDILKFYKNKIIYVLLPFVGFVLFWTIWDYVYVYREFNLPEILRIFYEAVMDTSADGHLWFMYPLFGLLLSTPFLSKMFHNMSDDELKILWRVAIGVNVVDYFLCANMGVSFRVVSWIFNGWVIYYFAGYYYRRVVSKESIVKWIILGLVGFAFTYLGMHGELPFFEFFIGATDIQPMFTLFCMGYLFCWDRVFRIRNKIVSKVILFLSKNTYLIYLFHMRAIDIAVRKLNIVEHNVGNGLLTVLGTFVFSLIAAFVTNLFMKPIQKFIDKVWTVK